MDFLFSGLAFLGIFLLALWVCREIIVHMFSIK